MYRWWGERVSDGMIFVGRDSNQSRRASQYCGKVVR
jgi:hypothetical protein